MPKGTTTRDDNLKIQKASGQVLFHGVSTSSVYVDLIMYNLDSIQICIEHLFISQTSLKLNKHMCT